MGLRVVLRFTANHAEHGGKVTRTHTMTETYDESALGDPESKAGRLRRAVLDRLRVHEREGTLPTSARFLFYELIQAGVVSKDTPAPRPGAKGSRRADQGVIDALTDLREAGLVPWDWIEDETRELTRWRTAPSVAEYVAAQVDYASLDPWGGKAPLILCESRSLAGALEPVAMRYVCPIASTNGQTRGFLVTKVAPTLTPGQRVLYLGDWDWCGRQIEEASRRTLTERRFGGGVRMPESVRAGLFPWERVALTGEQVETYGLPVISKADRRYRPARSFDAVETEALGQARIIEALTARLDALLPEPLADVREREDAQRAEVREALRGLLDLDGGA